MPPSLGCVPARAWSACERDGPLTGPHGLDQDTPSGWFSALARALQTGRVVAANAPALPDPAATQSSEAVLVEVEPDAIGLIGVQYAHERRARLVLTASPDTSAIADAIGSMSGRSGAKLFGGVRDWFHSLTESPDIAGPLKAIEKAVNDAVTAI